VKAGFLVLSMALARNSARAPFAIGATVA